MHLLLGDSPARTMLWGASVNNAAVKFDMGKCRTSCGPGLVKQDRVPALEDVWLSVKADSSMGANRYKEP